MPDDNRVTADDHERMVVAATLGRELVPVDEAARKLWESIKRQVAEIKAQGLIVDVPPDIP